MNRVRLVFADLTPNGFDNVVVLFSRVKRPVGDSEGTRTPDLQRDRLAFYATELRSHIYKIDFSLNLYVYIILKIYRKIKLFQKNFLSGGATENRTQTRLSPRRD